MDFGDQNVYTVKFKVDNLGGRGYRDGEYM